MAVDGVKNEGLRLHARKREEKCEQLLATPDVQRGGLRTLRRLGQRQFELRGTSFTVDVALACSPPRRDHAPCDLDREVENGRVASEVAKRSSQRNERVLKHVVAVIPSSNGLAEVTAQGWRQVSKKFLLRASM